MSRVNGKVPGSSPSPSRRVEPEKREVVASWSFGNGVVKETIHYPELTPAEIQTFIDTLDPHCECGTAEYIFDPENDFLEWDCQTCGAGIGLSSEFLRFHKDRRVE